MSVCVCVTANKQDQEEVYQNVNKSYPGITGLYYSHNQELLSLRAYKQRLIGKPGFRQEKKKK